MRRVARLSFPFLAIDLARIKDPSLKDKPLVVIKPSPREPLVLSPSREARQEGIRQGMRLYKALKIYPSLCTIHADPGLYRTFEKFLISKISKYTPLYELGNEGCYMDMSGTRHIFPRLKDTLWNLKRILGDLGFSLRAGLATNKLVSQVASRFTNGETLVDVPEGNEAGFLASQKIGILPGVDRKIKDKLGELDVRYVGEILSIPLSELVCAFGKRGIFLRQKALGEDHTPIRPPGESPIFIREMPLPSPLYPLSTVKDYIKDDVLRSASQLRKMRKIPSRLTLFLMYKDGLGARITEKFRESCLYDLPFLSFIRSLLERLMRRRVALKYMEIQFFNMSPRYSSELFPDTKEKNLSLALDKMRERYGWESVRVGY